MAILVRGRKPGAASAGPGDAGPPGLADRPLVITGAIGACAAAGVGLAVLTLLVVVGWIAAPHAGSGLTGVLRTAALLWLIAHHVGFELSGVGPIGMLPLGLVLLPGALLWRAGRWLVRVGGAASIRQVGYTALALAAPYAMIAGALAVASRSARVAASVPEAVAAAFLLALTAGGLGGARALAPWPRLAELMPARLRSVTLGAAGALAVLCAAGAVLTGVSIGLHLRLLASISGSLDPGLIGGCLLLLLQLAYLPNAVVWAVAFTLGPGFAFGTGTVVAPTGTALAQLPALPMLAALPPGVHSAPPAWFAAVVLGAPYLAGVFGGVLVARAAPTAAWEAAPLRGFGSGVLAAVALGILAVFSGGPLGAGRLSAVGPSAWQVTVVAALEVGVAAAVSAAVVNWLRLRGRSASGDSRPSGGVGRDLDEAAAASEARLGAAHHVHATEVADGGAHVRYLNPWAGEPGGNRTTDRDGEEADEERGAAGWQGEDAWSSDRDGDEGDGDDEECERHGEEASSPDWDGG